MKNEVIHTCYGCELFYDNDELLGIKSKTVSFPIRHCEYTDKWKCEYFRGKSYENESEEVCQQKK